MLQGLAKKRTVAARAQGLQGFLADVSVAHRSLPETRRRRRWREAGASPPGGARGASEACSEAGGARNSSGRPQRELHCLVPVFTKSKVWVEISFCTFILFLEKSKERLSDSPEVSGARNEEGVTCFISVSRRPGLNREEKWGCGRPRVLFFCPPETPEGN